MAARVIAFPGVALTEIVPAETPVTSAPCPVCAYPIRSDELDVVECTRCARIYHHPCFWRLLPLADWTAYWTWFDSDAVEHRPWDYVCAACRWLEDLEKGGA